MADTPDVTSPRVLTELFDNYGLKPNRQFGQNFLVDANIARKIITAAGIEKGDAIIEIGPGAGALTVQMAKLGATVLAIEIDRGLIRLLGHILKRWPEVRVLEQDVLKINWQQLIGSYFSSDTPVKMVSNLPYAISGPFMYDLFKAGFPLHSAVLMFQKEVAGRLVADPGSSNYGALSVLSRYYTTGKVLFDVSGNVFWPRPKIGSAVLRLQPHSRDLSESEEEHLWYLVQGVFQQRRKTMLNNLARLFPDSRPDLPALMAKVPIDSAVRPEQLTAGQFAKLARITYNYHK